MDNTFPDENLIPENVKHSVFNIQVKKIIFYIIFVVFSLIFFNFFFVSPPTNFPNGSMFNVSQGSTLRSVSMELKNKNIIRSRTAFEAFVIILGREKHVISGDYYFEDSLPVYLIARRISKGEHHIAPISVTIPEGFDNTEIAEAFSAKLNYFNKDRFILNAKNQQGRLFPDTYFFLSTDNENNVLMAMSKNFEKKFSTLRSSIESSGKNEKDILVMASIIEKEAKGDADRENIAAILWKRISIGMPLQVDAARETYKFKGLPNIPICNPGLFAIQAAIEIKNSAYLYYLHDKYGVVHYAKTFTEHNANIRKYLK